MEQTVDLRAYGFDFAVEEIPQEIGTLEAWHVDWNSVSGKKIKTRVPIAPCKDNRINTMLTTEYTMARTSRAEPQ